MVIIGLAGKKQSGKDTAFKYIKKFDARAKRYAFADPLKRMCQKLFGLTNEQIRDKNSLTHIQWKTIQSFPLNIRPNFVSVGMADKKYLSVRELLQIFGTDICRQMFDPNVWVKLTFEKIKKDKPEIAVITDARFLEEINEVKKYNGLLFRIVRNSLDQSDSHRSEVALDRYKKWDAIIENNGTKKEFEKSIEIAISKCLLKK